MQATVSFHNLRHRAESAEAQINAFLTHLAVKGASAPRTTYRGKSPVHYTETLYCPVLSDADALSACDISSRFDVISTDTCIDISRYRRNFEVLH